MASKMEEPKKKRRYYIPRKRNNICIENISPKVEQRIYKLKGKVGEKEAHFE